jgi:CBS domain-containing protein
MLRLRDIMTTELLTVSPDLSIRDAMELLAARHVSGAPVVVGHKVVGVVTLTDLVGFAAGLSDVPKAPLELMGGVEGESSDGPSEGEEPTLLFFSTVWDDGRRDVSDHMLETGGREWNMLEEHTVDEAMTRSVKAMDPEMPVDRAADFMRSFGGHRLLVMDGATLLGIVTTKDIADAVADHRIAVRSLVFGRRAERDERGW